MTEPERILAMCRTNLVRLQHLEAQPDTPERSEKIETIRQEVHRLILEAQSAKDAERLIVRVKEKV